MVGWHHLLDGHEFEQALGVGDGQGSLVCYSPRGCKELDMTERLMCSLFGVIVGHPCGDIHNRQRVLEAQSPRER